MLEKYLPRTDFDSYEDFKANFKINIPDNFNFAFDIVDEWAKIDRSKMALVWVDGKGGRRDYTFADMKVLSDKAACLFKRHGVGKGDRVMLMLKQRPEAWICFLALCKIGAVCIPATYQLTPKDIIYRCNAADVCAIVSVDDAELVEHIEKAAPDCEKLKSIFYVSENPLENLTAGKYDFKRELENEPTTEPERITENSDTMLIYFSSGTTGMPKMIVHDFTYPLGHIITAKYWQNVKEDKLHLTMSDSGWAKFAWGKIYGQWICGATIVAYDNEKFDAKNTLETITSLGIYSFCAPPTVFRFLIKEDIAHYDFSSIKHCSIAGEPLNPEVWERFRELTGLTLCEGFGQTETPVILANFPWIEIKPGSTGKPSPLYDIDIVDENGNTCDDGIVGRIVVKNIDKFRPVGLVLEYHNDAAANEKAFGNGYYDTGDTAWRDGDGYFWFVGRSDDVIKCSGYRIGPFEVESALMTHRAVLECAVTAAPDPVRGQVVKATIVLARGYEASDEIKKELQDHVKHVTAPYKYPRIIEFVKELPKTISGKIKRADIRKCDEK